MNQEAFFTGIPGLDEILTGVRLGDNVVFQVGAIEDYLRFVRPFCFNAQKEGRPLIYFRFADHDPVVPDGVQPHVYKLHPEEGFENFISEIFDVIEKFGKGAFYVFDSLSELAVDWYSDRMLGSFFMLTCPYLYDFDTVAYFALLRNHHTSFAVDAIQDTAQVVMDIYHDKEHVYVHPLKVDKRYSTTMYMLHKWEGETFIPVTRSSVISEILSATQQTWLDFSMQHFDIWRQSFLQAQKFIDAERNGPQDPERKAELLNRLLRMAVTREPRLLALVQKYFDIADAVDIGKRMIGTGLVGGKTAGMLLARAILKKKDSKWNDRLEPHDSFFIGADVFYTFLIRNKCWWIRRKLQKGERNPALSREARERILRGSFSREIEDQFAEMLKYFGQSPIIVRSSSLLEDAYGNAFSGKYESVFCVNQGTPQERLIKFMAAVRDVYASTLSDEALAYREHWGLLDRDEQMALLIQRVSGTVYHDLYFPQIAGVGFSFNPYVWNHKIDPQAGMMRLVFGLGTRAVDRIDDDYTRIVAMNEPGLLPETAAEDFRKYAQRKVDVLDLRKNCHASWLFEDVVKAVPELPLDIFASKDQSAEKWAREHGRENVFSSILTFQRLLSDTTFVDDMRSMLFILQEGYQHPVDIEFTTNFLTQDEYRINLVQCRPFQVKGNLLSVEVPKSVSKDKQVLEAHGPVIGNSLATTIDRIIYVVPEVYGQMNVADRYSVARLIGELTHIKGKYYKKTIMLIGPGRWATTTPALGVPVSFAEIDSVSVLCEVAAMHEGLIPEVSLGTHFFNDLVEMDMLYFAIHPKKENNFLNHEFFKVMENQLEKLVPEAASWGNVLRVIDGDSVKKDLKICLCSDVLKQNVVCYLGLP
ncbi:MAG: PEP/pyruvate-binding domain-containing protein [Candidatus Omnitrophota bacterium]